MLRRTNEDEANNYGTVPIGDDGILTMASASRSTFPGRRTRASGSAAASAKTRRMLSSSLSVNSSVVDPISEAAVNMADGCVAFRSLFQDSEAEVCTLT